MKRLLIMSDGHSGQQVGLTHPDFDAIPSSPGPKRDLYNIRRRGWKFFADTVDELRPIDVLLYNGDAIDGKGKRSGGTELLTSDRSEQVSMAVAAIEYVQAKTVVMSYGTPYHTGDLEDWEDEIAKSEKVKARKIGGHDWIDVNGLIFDYKHFIPSSSVPYGRQTQLSKEHVWNVLWSEHGEYPKSDVIIRSHVHYFTAVVEHDWMGVITPALQFKGTKFGSRKMSGVVHYGLVWFDVENGENFTWNYKIWKPRLARRHIIQV